MEKEEVKAKSLFMSVYEVMEILDVSKNKAYDIIRKLNKKLEKEGYVIVAGKVSRKYFEESVYM